MDFSWTPEQSALRERIVEFAERKLNDENLERDREGVFATSAWKHCADFGIQSMSIPAAYNSSGVDTDIMSALVAMEAIGYGSRDNGLGMALAAQMWTVQRPIAEFGTEELKNRYLPAMCAGDLVGAHAVTELEAGSDHLAMQTLAEPVDGGYVINGAKRYITLGPVADVALLFATTDPTKGRWGISAFLVDTDTPGCELGPVREKMGLRTVPMGDILFEDCRIPDSRRLGPEGSGASISSGALAVERCFILSTQIGAMERQLEQAVRHARTRHQFGQPIGKFQSVSNRIADMKLKLETSRLLLYRTAWKIQRGESVTLDSALLKLHLSESLVESSLDAIRLHGAIGYLTEHEIERDLRDAVGGVILAGTSDIQRVLIARLLGL